MRLQSTQTAAYSIVGADGRSYGPVTLDTLRAWTSAGRLDWTTQVIDDATGQWCAAGEIPELSAILARLPPVVRPAQAPETVAPPAHNAVAAPPAAAAQTEIDDPLLKVIRSIAVVLACLGLPIAILLFFRVLIVLFAGN